jgi:hypothetical protein
MPEDGYASVSVPTDDYEQAEEYKPDSVTWGEVLVTGAERLNDHIASDLDIGLAHEAGMDIDVLAQSVRDELDTLAFNGALTEDEAERLMSALKAIEERTGRIERTLDDLEGRR